MTAAAADPTAPLPSNNITLIGMPGAGKSTIGRELANQLGYWFIDTDVIITEHHGCPLQEIAAERGVDGLRRAEDEAVMSLRVRKSVLSPGGSIVFGAAAMAHLQQISTIVYIAVPLGELSRRVGTDLKARGIVHQPGQDLGDVMNERLPLYEKFAQYTFAFDPDAPAGAAEAARQIAKMLRLA